MRATIFAIIVLAFGFQTDTSAQQQPTLKDAYKGCFLVGAALNPAQFSGAGPAGRRAYQSPVQYH